MSKIDIYKMVTDRIVEELEKGNVPWEWCIPWHGVRSGAFNRISKKSYSLLNQMLLKHNNDDVKDYATYNQWQQLGGKIRKGEKAEFVVFWKILSKEEINESGEKVVKNIPILKYYNVFHISQVDGVEPLPQEKLQDIEPIVEVDKILNDYISRENIKFEQTASNEAYYSPNRDLIHLPLMEQFKTIEEYYSTLAHEAIHSSMLESRCNRPQKNMCRNSESYSMEELVAECGSAMILNSLGIETANSFKNSVAYLKSWISILKNDSKFIVSASSKAEKAARYILGESIELGE